MTPPVVLLGYNRPDLTRGLIESLRSERPSVVYFAVDGPKSGNNVDAAAVLATRSMIDLIDWRCSIKPIFYEHNLGCGMSVSSTLSTIFKTEERIIVLEDDIRVHADFFPFMKRLLDRYAENDRIGAVCGCNVVPSTHMSNPAGSYRFSRFHNPWGWGTWRRSWSNYNFAMQHWWRDIGLKNLAHALRFSPQQLLYWSTHFEAVRQKRLDTWDYQFLFANLASNRLIAFPNSNLVENLGFRADATHSIDAPAYLNSMAMYPLQMPLSDISVSVDPIADRWLARNVYRFPFKRALQRFIS